MLNVMDSLERSSIVPYGFGVVYTTCWLVNAACRSSFITMLRGLMRWCGVMGATCEVIHCYWSVLGFALCVLCLILLGKMQKISYVCTGTRRFVLRYVVVESNDGAFTYVDLIQCLERKSFAPSQYMPRYCTTCWLVNAACRKDHFSQSYAA